MARYQIQNPLSGRILGIYEGDTPAAAIDACYRDAGYTGKAGYESETGSTDGDDLVAREVE